MSVICRACYIFFLNIGTHNRDIFVHNVRVHKRCVKCNMDNGGLTLETEAMLNHLSEVVMGSVFNRNKTQTGKWVVECKFYKIFSPVFFSQFLAILHIPL